uniref:E3 ubiquitin-protein ligase RLIM n=1 Tax=Doryrhamphus excisus TaxID=161450 RepID=UPI0025AEB96B|nr:E3 ubiquitin-protein ligase RLIM [Doryrhamphus excisus]
MDSDEQAEVFPAHPRPSGADEEDEEEDDDAKIFNAWMQRYRGGQQKNKPEEDADNEADERAESRNNSESAVRLQSKRRSSLPCLAPQSTMQLAHVHSCTQTPVTAGTLLRRSSSRRLLPSQHDAASNAPVAERRSSLIPTIPECIMPDRKTQFRRRNASSLSDADSTCRICRNTLNQGSGGLRELQCTHTFHRECIEEWLWKKQLCPTCNIQVLTPQQGDYWSSTKVSVP